MLALISGVAMSAVNASRGVARLFGSSRRGRSLDGGVSADAAAALAGAAGGGSVTLASACLSRFAGGVADGPAASRIGGSGATVKVTAASRSWGGLLSRSVG